MVTPVMPAGATPPGGQGQEHAEGVVGVGPEVVGPSDYGWFQWVKLPQIPEYEAAGWKLSACVSRFHFDSYLMFKPSEQTVQRLGQPPARRTST